MPEALLKCIEPVTQRLRQVRWWRSVTVVALLAAGTGLLALLRLRGVGPDSALSSGTEMALLILVGTLGGVFAAWCFVRFSYHDTRAIASRIEAKFPTLQQRLLTALSQGSSDGNEASKPLGYLQRRVIDETRDHARTHRWVETVPAARLFWSRLSGLTATAALAAILILLAVAAPDPVDSPAAARALTDAQMSVEPGDTSIERGTGLVVTARFSGAVPDQAELVCVDSDGGERRVSMTRNLDDPVLGAFLASVDRPFSYQVLAPRMTSEQFEVDVFEYPSLVRADAELSYPEYTGRDDNRIEDTVRVAAVEGTSLTWSLFLNKPVDAAALVAEDGSRIELEASASQPERVTATLPMDATGRWTLALRDDDGRENQSPAELFARVIPNQPPKLKLLTAGDQRVSPLEEFPVAAEVRDDFGIAQVGLSYHFAEEPEEELVLQESVPGGATETVDHLVEFEQLAAVPDQLLAYHFWAEDIGPDGQPRRTESDLYFAEVRPFEEIFREGEQPPGGQQQQQQQQQSQNGQEAEELAELQKQIINATWNVKRRETASEPTEAYADDVSLIAESQREAIAQLEELVEQLRDDESREHADQVGRSMAAAEEALERSVSEASVDPLAPALSAEQQAYQGLLKLRAREFQVTRQQQQQGGQSGQSASSQQRQQQLEELELSNEENRYETEQQAQPSSQEQEERETRQVLSRLRDLARRQEDLNQQMAQLQSALEQAESDEERQEIERQLKRLRDQQENMLREVDELSERMQMPENQERMADAAEELAETRQNIQQATEALSENDASEALTSGTRAERELSEMRDEFRREAAGEYADAVRDMRRSAQELDEQQQELGEQLESVDQNDEPGLRSGNDRDEIGEQLGQQQQRLNQLLEEMKRTIEEAELSEPLLSQKLYESFRKTEQRQVDEKLQATGELIRRGFDEEGRQLEADAREGIGELREGLEEAAEAVLGDETKALERALGELEQLTRDLDDEIRRRGGEGEDLADDGQLSEGQPGNGEPGEGEPREAPGSEGQAAEDGQGGDAAPRDGLEQPQAEDAGQPQAEGSDQGGSPSGESSASPSGGSSEESSNAPSEASGSADSEAGDSEAGAGGLRPGADRSSDPRSGGPGGGGIPETLSRGPTRDPLTGEGFREWSDRLRDVEEMVDDPELRSQAARVRDRAREVRRDLRRHATEPQWPMVEELIAAPLRELHRDVAEELMRRAAERNANVPIDRDPVPDRYTDAVRLYYERLGAGR